MSRLKVDQIEDRSGSGISLDASLKFKQYTTSTKSITGTPLTTLIITSSVDSPHSPIILH